MDRLSRIIKEFLLEKKKKRDRCLRIADRKFDKPSAYKSGAVVRCRKCKIWKVVKEDNSGYQNLKQPVSNGVANGVNEFDQKLQESKAQQAVVKTNKEYVSPARNGMIFNNTIKLYIANDMAWTQDEFVSNYKRVESFLDSCENAQETKPFELPVEKPVQPKVAPSATYTADHLPF